MKTDFNIIGINLYWYRIEFGKFGRSRTSIRWSHFGHSEEPKVGGIWPEVRGNALPILLVFVNIKE